MPVAKQKVDFLSKSSLPLQVHPSNTLFASSGSFRFVLCVRRRLQVCEPQCSFFDGWINLDFHYGGQGGDAPTPGTNPGNSKRSNRLTSEAGGKLALP